eukprot:11894337-Alexandrium_andersonii.AAC.1
MALTRPITGSAMSSLSPLSAGPGCLACPTRTDTTAQPCQMGNCSSGMNQRAPAHTHTTKHQTTPASHPSLGQHARATPLRIASCFRPRLRQT